MFPPEAPDEPDLLKQMRKSGGVSPESSDYPEKLDFIASADQVRVTNPLGNLPLVVLTRNPAFRGNPDLPPDLDAKIEQVWQNLQNDLAGLSSNSTHVIATKAGPYIPLDEPQLVIDAILKVVADSKK